MLGILLRVVSGGGDVEQAVSKLGRRATTDKVSHSLHRSIVERLKRLAYVERVSESAIIEFVLEEFLSLGDDETLGTVLRAGGLSLRRNRPAPGIQPQSIERLMEQLASLRRELGRAAKVWEGHPCTEHLREVGIAKARLVALRNQIGRAGRPDLLDAQAVRVGE